MGGILIKLDLFLAVYPMGPASTVVVYREEREKKLERARRAKATMEENPNALRKGKWSRCTQ